MIKKSVLFGLCFLLTSLVALPQNWNQVSRAKSGGGSIDYINYIQAYNDTLFVASTSGIWISPSGNGGDWQQYGTGLNSTSVVQLAISENVRLARVSGNQLYRLTSAGSWQAVDLTTVGHVAVQSSTGYAFAAKDNTGVYRSTDDGVSWVLYDSVSPVENLTGPEGSIGIIPDRRIWKVYPAGDYVLAQSKNAVHISEDNGENWYYRWGDMDIDHAWGSNLKWVYLYEYRGEKYLFAASDGSQWNGMSPNLSRSNNLGLNYQYSDMSYTGNKINGLPYSNGNYFRDFCNHADKALFLRSDYGGIYKSNDNGINWELLTDGLVSYNKRKLIATDNRLLLADYRSIWSYDLTLTPEWNDTYPTVTNVTGSTADITVSSKHKGRAYYVALPASEAAPDAEQILRGLNAANEEVAVHGSFPIQANIAEESTVRGMLSQTNYKIYITVTNSIGNPAELRLVAFTTAEPALTMNVVGNGIATPESGVYSGTIQLLAVADSANRFDRWLINGEVFFTPTLDLEMITDYQATARFLRIAPATVSHQGNGNTYPTGTTLQDVGRQFTVRAYPAQGYQVSHWLVNGSILYTSAQQRNVTVQASVNTIEVTFEPITLPDPRPCDSLMMVADLPRYDSVKEASFQARLQEMYGHRVGAYDDNTGYTGSNVGERYWSEKLAKLAMYPENDSFYISTVAPALSYREPGAGSFWYPFTAPGYAMYYFMYKDAIAKYDSAQLDTIYNTFYAHEEWKYLMRKDHYLDMVYPGGKEFNSENFHWMLRSAGYLFSQAFHDKNGNDNYNLTFTDVDGVSRHNANVAGYFEGYLNNMLRALYNAGRVEWNSNNYWAHTVNPLIALYEGTARLQTPDAQEAHKKSKAALDWMMVEAALHYLDGYQIAADARAKGSYLNSSPSATEAYTYAFFTDEHYRPGYVADVWQQYTASNSVAGFLLNTSYRPPQIVVDIAQKNISLPVEIQSAKPYYHIDFGDFWKEGEYPYHDWRGDTERGRRFEFETMFLGENYIMSSVAGGRPDGSKGTFSEQAQWEIGVAGGNNGAKQISGNAANYGYAPAGRCPQHEIGQFRNMMLHLVKRPSSNQFYLLIPDADNTLSASANGTWFAWEGNTLFLDLGSDVYMACKPYAATGKTVNTGTSLGSGHTQLTWQFSNNELGALLIEMGTAEEYGSFEDFMQASNALSVTYEGENTLSYTSVSGHRITMQYTGPGSYLMTDNTHDTPMPNPFSPAGSYPKVWGNGEYIDFQTWDSYRTVYGDELITQEWGSGVMRMQTAGVQAAIVVDPVSAQVSYLMKEEDTPAKQINFSYTLPDQFVLDPSIDPAFSITEVVWDFHGDSTWDITGDDIFFAYDEGGERMIQVRAYTDHNCYYQRNRLVNIEVSIERVTADDGWHVSWHPNPASSQVFITLTDLQEPVVMSLTNASGQLVRKLEIRETQKLLDVQGLQVGVYLISLQRNGELVYTGKMLIE